MFYDTLKKLCDENETTPCQVRKDLDISSSTMATWKSRGLTPAPATLARLANYFGVTVERLLEKTDSPMSLSDEMLQCLWALDLLYVEPDILKTAIRRINDAFKTLDEATSIDFDEANPNAVRHVTMKIKVALMDYESARNLMPSANRAHLYKMAKKHKHWNTVAKSLFDAFARLNAIGREKAAERIQELTMIPKYQRKR